LSANCRYAKKQVLDESGTLSNLLQLWQLVVRHPDVFYNSRAQFMSQMINTLSRIGMPTQASLENRKLSLDLAGLLLAWEDKRRQSLPPGQAAAAAAAQQTGVWMHQTHYAFYYTKTLCQYVVLWMCGV
jgi:transformation/transcription domain-associated protein